MSTDQERPSEYPFIDLNEYQEIASDFAVYPEAGTGMPVALAYAALGLSEAGEVQGKVKKILRGDYRDLDGHEGVRHDIALELGDLLWYVAQVASEIGYGLGEIALMNLNKLEDRANRGVIRGDGDNR